MYVEKKDKIERSCCMTLLLEQHTQYVTSQLNILREDKGVI